MVKNYALLAKTCDVVGPSNFVVIGYQNQKMLLNLNTNFSSKNVEKIAKNVFDVYGLQALSYVAHITENNMLSRDNVHKK